MLWLPNVEDSEDQEFYSRDPLEPTTSTLLPSVKIAAPSLENARRPQQVDRW